MALLNPMYDMLEQNMDQPLTELSKIKMLKRLLSIYSKFLEIYSEESCKNQIPTCDL